MHVFIKILFNVCVCRYFWERCMGISDTPKIYIYDYVHLLSISHSRCDLRREQTYTHIAHSYVIPNILY